MVKLIAISDIPKKERKSTSRFEATPQWIAARTELSAGIPVGQAIDIAFTAEQLALAKIRDTKTIIRFLKKYLKEFRLRDYSIQYVTTAGIFHIYIKHGADH